MKLSTLTAKLTSLKSNAVRVLAAATLAGAVLAAAPAAQAQQFGFGVRIGGPRYYAPPPPFYGRPAYPYGFYGYDHRHFDDWRFHHDHRYWR
jgi:hypothetical protein